MVKKPSAKKAFTPKQKADAQKERKQDLKELKKEIVDAKEKSNQHHFGFATAVVAGGGVANFIAFQNGTPSDLIAKTLTTSVVGGILLGLNKDFFFISGVYKEMLRHVNAELKRDSTKTVSDFKKIYDQSKEIREHKRNNNVPMRTTSYKRSADKAIVLITSIALANLGYTMYERQLFKTQKNEAVKTISVGSEEILKKFDPLLPGP